MRRAGVLRVTTPARRYSGDEPRRRRGRDAEILRRGDAAAARFCVAATPRPRRGDSVETSRGDETGARRRYDGVLGRVNLTFPGCPWPETGKSTTIQGTVTVYTPIPAVPPIVSTGFRLGLELLDKKGDQLMCVDFDVVQPPTSGADPKQDRCGLNDTPDLPSHLCRADMPRTDRDGGYSVETRRGAAAAATRPFRGGGESRRRRGRDAGVRPRRRGSVETGARLRYPPPEGAKLPTGVVDLNDPPATRWDAVIKPRKNQVKALVESVIDHLGKSTHHNKTLITLLLDRGVVKELERFPPDYAEEIRGVARAAEVPVWRGARADGRDGGRSGASRRGRGFFGSGGAAESSPDIGRSRAAATGPPRRGRDDGTATTTGRGRDDGTGAASPRAKQVHLRHQHLLRAHRPLHVARRAERRRPDLARAEFGPGHLLGHRRGESHVVADAPVAGRARGRDVRKGRRDDLHVDDVPAAGAGILFSELLPRTNPTRPSSADYPPPRRRRDPTSHRGKTSVAQVRGLRGRPLGHEGVEI